MKTLLSRLTGVILLLSTLCLGWSLVTNQSPKTGFFPAINGLSYLIGAIIGTWTMFLIVCIREKKGRLTFGLSIIGTTFIACHLWRIHTEYFRGIADIMRRFVAVSADTLSVGLALGEAFMAVVIVHVCIAKIFLARQAVAVLAQRSFIHRLGLSILGCGALTAVAVLICINLQWYGVDKVISAKLTEIVAGSESPERVMISSSTTPCEALIETQVVTQQPITPIPTDVVAKSLPDEQPNTVTPTPATPELDDGTPTIFSEALITQLKLFENEPLATGEIKVSEIHTDKISGRKVLEVGYGITPEEIKELILHGFLPEGSKLPSKLTAKEADIWLRTKTLPCYEMQVKATIGRGVYASLNICQRFALISFCHNLGKTALSEVFEDPEKNLSVPGLEKTCAKTARYVHANHIEWGGLVKRRFFEIGLYHSGALTKSNLPTSSAGIGSKPTTKPTKTPASQIKPPFLPDGSVDEALVGQIKDFEKDIVVPVINATPKS